MTDPHFRCCSYVGRQKRGAQKMALDHGCLIHGILLHELGHVIGFWHEQNRPDRDDYIQVLPNYHVSYMSHGVYFLFQTSGAVHGHKIFDLAI